MNSEEDLDKLTSLYEANLVKLTCDKVKINIPNKHTLSVNIDGVEQKQMTKVQVTWEVGKPIKLEITRVVDPRIIGDSE